MTELSKEEKYDILFGPDEENQDPNCEHVGLECEQPCPCRCNDCEDPEEDME